MLMKSGYLIAAGASLGLMLFGAPRGTLLTSSPARGKVERKTAAGNSGMGGVGALRGVPMFILIGGIHGGK